MKAARVRPEKQYMIDEIRRLAAGSEFVFMLDYTGLSVERMSQLRGRLRAEGSEIHVVRNRLMKLVGNELGWPRLEEFTRKPTAMVTGKDDIAAARVLKEFAKADIRPIAIKGGVTNGEFLPSSDIFMLADLPSKVVLQGKLVGTIAAPLTGFVSVLNQKVASIVYVLKAVEAKKGG